MEISVAVPNNLTDVSNGKFAGKTDLGDGYTRWDWDVHYPINNYNVSLNIGALRHFSDKYDDLTARFLRAARGSRKSQKAVFAGAGNAQGLRALFRADTRSKKTATS